MAKARRAEKGSLFLSSLQGRQWPAWLDRHCGFVLSSQAILETGRWLLGRRVRAPASSSVAGILLWPRVLTPEGAG